MINEILKWDPICDTWDLEEIFMWRISRWTRSFSPGTSPWSSVLLDCEARWHSLLLMVSHSLEKLSSYLIFLTYLYIFHISMFRGSVVFVSLGFRLSFSVRRHQLQITSSTSTPAPHRWCVLPTLSAAHRQEFRCWHRTQDLRTFTNAAFLKFLNFQNCFHCTKSNW